MLTELTRQKFDELAKLVKRRSSRGRWLILTHDNPDPDSIASAAALSKLMSKSFHRPATVAYGGLIGRAENQEMVKALGIRLSHVRYIKWKHYKHFALVDCQPGTGNNQLPERLTAEIVFDHHPPRRATQKVRFTDIRPDYGATATILAEYLHVSGLEITKKNATALVYAIRSETQDFAREFTGIDKKVYDTLHPMADIRALARIQNPAVPVSYFRTVHEGLENMETVGTLVISHLGDVKQPDIVPEIADLLLRMQGKTWSLTTGFHADRLYLSMRTSNPRADSGQLMRRLLGRRGKGGGHGMMAGGYITLDNPDHERRDALPRQMAKKLAKMLKKNPDRMAPIELSPNQQAD